MTGIQHLVRYAERAGKASDYEPVVLVVGRLAEECGTWGHGSCERKVGSREERMRERRQEWFKKVWMIWTVKRVRA